MGLEGPILSLKRAFQKSCGDFPITFLKTQCFCFFFFHLATYDYIYFYLEVNVTLGHGAGLAYDIIQSSWFFILY